VRGTVNNWIDGRSYDFRAVTCIEQQSHRVSERGR
jgi:hypothetical protein